MSKLIGAEITGIEELNKYLTNVPKIAQAEVKNDLNEALLDLRGKAAALAPHDLGDLEGSANSGVMQSGNNIEGFVSFDTPYATRQHEELEWQHEPGRQAKYLEEPLNENLDDYIKEIAEAVQRGLK